MEMASDCIFAVAFFISNVSTAHDFVVAHIEKSVIPVLVTDSQAKKNEYYNQFIYNNITLKDLFA